MAHKSSIILHELTAKALKVVDISGKLPCVAALQAEYQSSKSNKNPIRWLWQAEKPFGKYSVIKQNIDHILWQDKEWGKEKGVK